MEAMLNCQKAFEDNENGDDRHRTDFNQLSVGLGKVIFLLTFRKAEKIEDVR